MMCEIIILFEGYSKNLSNGRMDANCSCVLIKGDKKVIVDTMTAWDKDKIIEALAAHNVKPEDIDFVVCTHCHADHIGNNNLFLNAEHIVGFTVHRGTIFTEKNLQEDSEIFSKNWKTSHLETQLIIPPAEHQLCEGIKIIPTPGHTYEDVSVLVETIIDGNKVTTAITGDLFEKEEDLKDSSIWENLGIPELKKTQAENRFLVIMIADYIVPGHGKMFQVTEDVRKLVEAQIPIDLDASSYSWKNTTSENL